MAYVKVRLEEDTVEKIVLDELVYDLKMLKRDLRLREKGEGFAVFDVASKEDIRELKKYVKAAKLMVKYHSISK